jgi:rod shape-determining protein MreD
MRIVRHILLLILAFVLQTTWVEALEVAGLKPDLIILVLIHIALRTGSMEGTLLGFCVGFLQDTHTPADLGLNALVKTLVGFCVGYCRAGVVADNVQVQIALIFAAVLLHDLVFFVGSSGVAWTDVPFFWLRYSVGRALYTSLIGVFIYAALLLRSRFSPA